MEDNKYISYIDHVTFKVFETTQGKNSVNSIFNFINTTIDNYIKENKLEDIFIKNSSEDSSYYLLYENDKLIAEIRTESDYFIFQITIDDFSDDLKVYEFEYNKS